MNPPAIGTIRQDVRRELGSGCSLDMKLAEASRLEQRVEPPNPTYSERGELVNMLNESAEEAYQEGLTSIGGAIDARREMHDGGAHPDDNRSAPGNPGDFY